MLHKNQSLTLLVHWILVALLLALGAASTTAGAAKAEAQERPVFPPASLLQFACAGHIVGFEPQRMYLAALDHALGVEFLEAQAVTPQSDSLPADSRTLSGVPPLGRVLYPDLWPGITLIVEAEERGIAKSTFLLQPHADAAMIKLQYNTRVTLADDGSLQFWLTYGQDRGAFAELAPVAWQDIAGSRVPVPVKFTVSDQSVVGFQLGEYDSEYPLTIDPIYQWHTFYGSDGSDIGINVSVDAYDNLYIAGTSGSSWLGDGDTAPLHAHSGGGYDLAILKLSSSGAYQWHTFYPARGLGDAIGIVVDNSGNIYVTKESDASWLGDDDTEPLHPHSENGNNIVVLKLSSSGAYNWHTFYGASGYDWGTGIALDEYGHVYIAGYSFSSWLGDDDTAPLHDHSGHYDLVVLRLLSGGAYDWHTFYGGSGDDRARGIRLGSGGNVYITGDSNFSWQGDNNKAPLHAHSGSGDDIVLLKLSSGGAFQWHTFYGSGSGETDQGWSIALDSSDNIYVTGLSEVSWQGDENAGPLHAHSGYSDIVVLKLSSGGAYAWHTFYGGSGDDRGYSIAVHSSGYAYIAGYSFASWQGDGDAAPLRPYSGHYDLVVLKLSSTGAYDWHTFYGASYQDVGHGITVDSSEIAYVTGYSGTWQGDNDASPLHPNGGAWDILVLKLDGTSPHLGNSTKTASPTSLLVGDTVSYTITLLNEGSVDANDVLVTDTLPVELEYVPGSLSATDGSYGYTTGVITWTGTVARDGQVELHYQALAKGAAPIVSNSAAITGGGGTFSRNAQVTISTPPPPPILTYLPLVRLNCTSGAIGGRVTYQGASLPGTSLMLRFYNGSSWLTLATTTTDSNGQYSFSSVPTLQNGQRYYVRYSNPGNPNHLRVWRTRDLTWFSASDCTSIGDFDLANIGLRSPPSGAAVPLPYRFYWILREATPTDRYEWNLFDPTDLDPWWWTQPPLGYAAYYQLDNLPVGFTTGNRYGWFVAVYSPDGGYGESYYYRSVTFSTSGSSADLLRLPLKPRSIPEIPLPPKQEAR